VSDSYETGYIFTIYQENTVVNHSDSDIILSLFRENDTLTGKGK
jgi:hypothetical protein